MKRLSLVTIALGLFASACGSSSTSPTTPTNPTFTATLSPANEVPPITNAESTASGNATITLVTTKDAAGKAVDASKEAADKAAAAAKAASDAAKEAPKK